MENKKGERFSPWRTPIIQGKKSDFVLLYWTHDLILVYILYITWKHFPFIWLFCNLNQSPVLQMVSKAFLKSMNVQNNFLPKDKYNETSTCMTNILSVVECPFLKPAWFLEINSSSLEKKFSLSFIIEVKSLPRQLMSVIARKLSGSCGFPLF